MIKTISAFTSNKEIKILKKNSKFPGWWTTKLVCKWFIVTFNGFVLGKFWDTFKTSKQSLYDVREVTSIFKLGEGFVAKHISVHQYRLTSR